MKDCLFDAQVERLQAAYTVKNYFIGAFQAFRLGAKRSPSKVLI